MKVLIRKAKIVSATSPLNGQITDILIENGIITQINSNIDLEADKVIDINGLHVSEGWMDCFANFCDPGFEFREDLQSGARAAAAGGFTDVMLMPNTQPPVQSKSQVEYLLNTGAGLPANIHPTGAITKNIAGTELTEIYDMKRSGAVAFSDGSSPIQSSGMMLKALQYVLAFNGTIIQVPDDKNIGSQGLMNEGIISTRLGLPGKPAISEELMVARDIELLKYTGSRLHITGISTKRSLSMIIEAREQGYNISCSVTPYHIFFCDEDLTGYDTNLKVNPPLRKRGDMMALREGIKNKQVDCFASHHEPLDWDAKTCEFEYAKPGMSGLESLLGVAGICGIDIHDFIRMQTGDVRNVFNLPLQQLNIGEKASLTLFNPEEEYIFSETDIYSKSRNNAFVGQKLKGRAFGIINGDKLFLK